MRCSRCREAVSARLDGEPTGVPVDRVDAHLAECHDCQAWAAAAGSLAPASREVLRDRVALDPHVLATLLAEARPRTTATAGLRWWRFALVAIALAQLAAALPGSLVRQDDAAVHLVHELTSWDVGLSVGFLFLAWRPLRAWGALPLLTALMAGVVAMAAIDLLSGHALLGRELVHLLALAGLACVWALAQRVPRPSIVLRLA
ncbi:MAG: zf-HC2 domain-containing protein [Acidimicrobiia bacterium]